MEEIKLYAVDFVAEAALMPNITNIINVVFPQNQKDPNDPNNYGLPLSTTGELPATHYFSKVDVSGKDIVAFDALGVSNLSGLNMWLWKQIDKKLVSTNNEATMDQKGKLWESNTAFKVLNLLPIV